jgi:uncharacterized protein
VGQHHLCPQYDVACEVLRDFVNGLLGQATLVAFSTGLGRHAEDGIGGNGPYAEAMTAAFETPVVEIGDLFRTVRDRVLLRTGNRQEPQLYGSLPAAPLYLRKL